MTKTDNISLKKITYNELKEKSYDLYDDNFDMVSGYFIDSTRKALLENPNLNDYTNTVLNVVLYNGKIVGRHMMMPTRIKIGDREEYAQTGGGIEIYEKFQGNGLGSIIVKDTILNRDYPVFLGQLYSSGVISIINKLDLCIFEKPLYNKMRKTRSIFTAKGYSGIILDVCSFIGDLSLKLKDISVRKKIRTLKKRYTVVPVSTVPDWVDEITLQDGHPYMEIHDNEWLQWNLDHVFSNNTRDKNYFYCVYDKTGKPAGFYMTKERFEENKNGGFYKNLIRGTLVEWGTRNEEELNEVDLNLFACSTFSKNVDKINTVISSKNVDVHMKNMGFSYRGMFKMSFQPGKDYPQDITNQDKWRIRYGGSNTILV